MPEPTTDRRVRNIDPPPGPAYFYLVNTDEPKRARALKIIAALKAAYPGARLALEFSTPLELLIALILAAQARDDVVNTVTPALFKKYRSTADWAAAKPETLQEEIHKITFFRNKTKSIQNACRALTEKHGGQVPDNLEALLELPGVGRKTANILLGNAFGQPAIGVDRHVARVAARLGLTNSDDPDQIEADLVPLIPSEDQVKFCTLVQGHGRKICAASKPKCPECPLNALCPFPAKAA